VGWRRVGVLVASLTAGAGLLAGCGTQSGLALARQSCDHVSTSIRLYEQAHRTSDAARASSLLDRAQAQLEQALQLAAQATSDDGSWNALMSALQENSRVDEGKLIPSLEAVCADAQSDTPGLPVTPPSNLPTEPGAKPSATTTTRPITYVPSAYVSSGAPTSPSAGLAVLAGGLRPRA
jgi:hypothetical protein